MKKHKNIFSFEGRNTIRMAIAGGSGVGKTTVVTNMLKNELYEVYDDLYLCHPEYDFEPPDENWNTIELKRSHIFKEFNEDLVKQLVAFTKRKFLRYRKKGKDYKACLILDDCVSDEQFSNKQRTEIGKAFTNSRKSGLSIIIITQKTSLLSQQILSNCNVIVLFNSGFGKELRTIEDSWGFADRHKWRAFCQSQYKDFRDTILIDVDRKKYYRNFEEVTFNPEKNIN